MRRVLIAVMLLVAACSGEAAQPPPPLEEVRTGAADAMLAVEAAAFTIERTGAPLRISGLNFVSATGSYLSPDRARAVLEVEAGEVTARLGTIAIGPQVWLTDPITGRWNELDEGAGFNPAIVFDPDLGWSAILRSDMTEATVDAVDADHIRLDGTVGPSRVATLTAGLAEAQPTQIMITLDRATLRITHVAFDTVGPDGTSSWTITLHDYDAPVTVEPPSA